MAVVFLEEYSVIGSSNLKFAIAWRYFHFLTTEVPSWTTDKGTGKLLFLTSEKFSGLTK